jgi:tetratricopeptide (TPR) repeat protein
MLLITLVLGLSAGCASGSGPGTGAAVPEPAVIAEPPAGSQASDESAPSSISRAIVDAAARLEARLEPGERLAIVNISSPSAIFSDYVIEELALALTENNKITVVDRNALNFALVQAELSFQMSGNVSDETQASIGKMLGAQSVLSASFVDMGDAYRFRLTVIRVETLVRKAAAAVDVARDSRLEYLTRTETPIPRKSTENPVSAYDFRRRGGEYFYNKDYDRAIADYTRAVRLNPQDVDAYYSRAYSYYEKQEYEKALADYTEVLRLNPNYGAAYTSRGYLYYYRRAYEQAITDFTAALSINPNDAAAYNNRALVYIDTEDYPNARQDLERSLAIADNPNTAINLAGVYLRLGNRQQALRVLGDAYSSSPTNDELRIRYETLRDTGMWMQ